MEESVQFVTGRPAILRIPSAKNEPGTRLSAARNCGRSPGIGSLSGLNTENGTTPRTMVPPYGNRNWEFAANGLMQRRFAKASTTSPIPESERKVPLGVAVD